MGKYRVVAVDPPWNNNCRSRRRARGSSFDRRDYEYMTNTQLLEFPINRWARKDATLFLWCLHKTLRLGFEILDAWGFKYNSTLVWVKNAQKGLVLNSCIRQNCEFVLVGYRDYVAFSHATAGRLSAWFYSEIHGHSVKPDCFYQNVRDVLAGPRIDLFARQHRAGWDAWGDQIEGNK